ncbi:helix-turn-helix domain-containing protein [Salinarimonas ramus]|uniref:Transcriptional regulator n=1 Tax=Salinarimonas ramus TaxID=690164 RepID=A0A917Q7S6_9HYPH|nr:helix-turn-helix domain-containing protein [Salinarimonas ramus]GGK32642.1 transcriptional regulator [Salinarimonas ramus]
MSKAGKRLIAAAQEVKAIVRGEIEPAHVHEPAALDVKAIRAKAGLSQDAFASTFGFTVNQIRDWEQGRSRPLGGVRAYLMIIERDPTGVRKMLDETRRTAA